MANTRISDFSAGSAIADTDVFPAVETAGVGPVKKTGLQLKTYAQTGVLLAANNLSDVTAATARTNLGLTALATTAPGTGVATALALNVGSAGAVVVNGGAGGTPSSLTLTNATGLPVGGIAAIGANTFVANGTGGSASPTALSAAAATALLSAMVGDSGSGGTKGLVPAPAAGDAAAAKFLKADGTWAVPAGGGGGGTPGGADTQVQFNDGGSFGGDSGLTFNKTTNALSVGGATVTINAPALNVTQTWNGTNTDTFYGMVVNVSGTPNTTHKVASPIFAVQLNGKNAAHFHVNSASDNSYVSLNLGGLNYTPGAAAATIEDNGSATAFAGGRSQLYLRASTNIIMSSATSVRMTNSAVFGWSSSPEDFAPNTALVRDGADNTMAMRNGVNAQTFNIYNTYTDGSNYERGAFKWDTNVLRIGTEKAGTGTARSLALMTNGTNALTINTSQNATFAGNVTAIGNVDSQAYFTWYNNAPSGWQSGASNGGIQFGSTAFVQWTSGNANGTVDTTLSRNAAAILNVRGSSSTTPGAFNFYTYGASPPAAPSASQAIIYADTSGGKIRLMALFPSGAAQQIAIEP